MKKVIAVLYLTGLLVLVAEAFNFVNIVGYKEFLHPLSAMLIWSMAFYLVLLPFNSDSDFE